MAPAVEAAALEFVVETLDGESVTLHGGPGQPLQAVYNEVKAKVPGLAIPANATVLFIHRGKEYQLSARLGDIDGLREEPKLKLFFRTAAG